jgi:hypothetical protein
MHKNSKGISRRSFVAGSAIGVTAAGGAFLYAKRDPIRRLQDKLQDNASPYRLDETAQTGSLSAGEIDNILSLARVLIPWEEGAPVVDEMTREFVDGRCQFQAGARDIYRSTSALLDRAAATYRPSAGFRDLERAQQRAIVAEIIPQPIRSRRDWRHSYNLLFRFEETQATELVVSEILVNFYDSDRSWAYLRAG